MPRDENGNCVCKTEVWSRVVGYYSAVQTWNKGKKEEYLNRRPFEMGGRAFCNVASQIRGHDPHSGQSASGSDAGAENGVMSPDLEERRRALRESTRRAGRLYNEGQIE